MGDACARDTSNELRRGPESVVVSRKGALANASDIPRNPPVISQGGQN